MSVMDYLNLIDPLIDPRSHGGEAAQAFHLVIPSLPGFGFSGPTTERGWDRYRVARAWAELMRRLGYDRYGAHGMDWGSIVSPEVGRFDPEHVIGVHVTEIFSFPSGDPTELEALSEKEKEHWQSFQWWIDHKGAYHSLQSTVPQTLAHALADSPVGQLAWNYQIYGDAVSFDYILTNVMVYWLTNTAASSARFYYENAHAQHVPTGPTTIPLGPRTLPTSPKRSDSLRNAITKTLSPGISTTEATTLLPRQRPTSSSTIFGPSFKSCVPRRSSASHIMVTSLRSKWAVGAIRRGTFRRVFATCGSRDALPRDPRQHVR